MQLLFSSGKKPATGPTRREKKMLIALMVVSILLTTQIGELAFMVAISAAHRGRVIASLAWLVTPFTVWIGSVIFFKHYLRLQKLFHAFLAALFPLAFFLLALLYFYLCTRV